MKIGSSNIKSIGGPVVNSGGTAKPANGASRPVASGGERVALSPLSARLQEISGGDTASVVDTARVAEIRQAIAEGHFKVNPERIADGLLDSVRQMLTASR